MKKKLLILLLPVAVFSKTVDFDTALSLTMQNNQQLKAKKLEVESAKKEADEADSYNYGTFAINETVSNTNHPGYIFGMKMAAGEATFRDFGFKDFLTPLGNMFIHDPATGNHYPMTQAQQDQLLDTEPDDLNEPDARTNVETKFTYDVPLFVGYKLESGRTMATLQGLAKEAKYNHDEKALGLSVLQAYNGAVTAKRFIELTKKGKARAESFIKTATDMYNKRLTRIIDVKQAKMAYKSIDTKLKEAENKYDVAIAYLRFLTGDDTITDVGELKTAQCSITTLPELQQIALKNRDDLTWMEYNARTMEKKIAYDTSDKYPTIGAHVEYGFNDDGLSIDSDHDYYLVAVGLKFNIFDGGLTKVKKEKAQLDYLKTKNYQELMTDGIRLEVEKNYLELQTKKRTLKEKIETGKMSEEILDETVKIYKNNLNFRTNMMYLLMSLQGMMTAQADVIMSEYERTIAAARLKLSLGRSLSN